MEEERPDPTTLRPVYTARNAGEIQNSTTTSYNMSSITVIMEIETMLRARLPR